MNRLEACRRPNALRNYLALSEQDLISQKKLERYRKFEPFPDNQNKPTNEKKTSRDRYKYPAPMLGSYSPELTLMRLYPCATQEYLVKTQEDFEAILNNDPENLTDEQLMKKALLPDELCEYAAAKFFPNEVVLKAA